MISTRDIKRKIKTIRNIQQMCRAMKTVSLVKLQKAEMRLAAARPFAGGMTRCLSRLAAALGEKFAPAGEEQALLVITSDKGLCGGYNSAVLRRVQQEAAPGAAIVAAGRKGERFLRRRGYHIVDSLSPLGSEPTYNQVIPLADRLTTRLQSGGTASLRALHGRFLRGTRSEITAYPLFPPEKAEADIIFEPRPEQMLEPLLKRYLRASLYAAVLEGSASEHGARVAAMSAATDNAEEIIHDLVMDYNKARQASITKELSEIVGSAEALR